MNNPIQLFQMVNQLKSNPMSFLANMGVPNGMTNDPQKIIQNLMNNGKVTQEQYDKAVKRAQSMGFKF